MLLPSDLLRRFRDLPSDVAIDTETSGLYTDDGARIAAVSMGWIDFDGLWDGVEGVRHRLYQIPNANVNPLPVVSVAWPFDQGVEGKPEDDGQFSLFGQGLNLPVGEWRDLLSLMAKIPNHVYHHAKFDLSMFKWGCRRWPEQGGDFRHRLAWDTQNVAHMLHPLEGTSLKPTFGRLFEVNVTDEQDAVKAYLRRHKLPPGRYDLVPWDIMEPYADQDAAMTIGLMAWQIHAINHFGAGNWLGGPDQVLFAMARRLATTHVLTNMEWRGVPYDEAGSNEAAIECDTRAAKMAQALPFEPPTLAHAKNYFFSEAGLDLVPYGVSGKTQEPSMTAEIVQRMVNDEIPHADTWAAYQKVKTASSMWYRAYAEAVGSDGRLRTCFRQNGTVSSRFSVERINLQAMPHDYRLSEFAILEGIPTPRQLVASAVAAMPGWGLWELDLAQAELRVAAMLAKCRKMLNMIIADEDLHTYTTLELFDNVTEDDPLFKDKWRQIGKRGNFSLCFGAEAATFRGMVSKEAGIILDESESMRIVRDWNALYPEFRRAIEVHSRKVQTRQRRYNAGWLSLNNGERRWFQQYEDVHKAFNQRVQGNLAQFGIDWMLAVEEISQDALAQSSYHPRTGGGLVLTIHDSQVLLLPDDVAASTVAACAQAGRDLWKQWFPDVPGDVDFKKW